MDSGQSTKFMYDLLRLMLSKKGSDLFITADFPPAIKLDGKMTPVMDQRLTGQHTADLVRAMMNDKQAAEFEATKECNFAISPSGIGRFRVNCFVQQGKVGMVLRTITTKIPELDDLGLPEVLKDIVMTKRGLVIVVGGTGSGKSTTLAAMLGYRNQNSHGHIITIEDPIEFLHRDKKGFVNQREVGVDTSSFSAALRASLREDPDVILVGEMRDHETIGTALLAAETGHMVFSTLHTLDATETIQRIIAVFPPPEQKQIRLQLASTLKSIVSQRLVRKSDGIGRVPAVEVLIATEYIRDCIINPEKTRLIHDAIASGVSQYGMQTFDQSLYDLYSQGLITLDEALVRATNPDEFKLRIAGIRSTADAAREEMERASQVDRFAKR